MFWRHKKMIYISSIVTATGVEGNVWAQSENSLKPHVSKYCNTKVGHNDKSDKMAYGTAQH